MGDNSELERYARHVVLNEVGFTGQNKFLTTRILLIGLGGIGSIVFAYLVGAGIGKIGIVDADIVSLSDLHRQIIYRVSDIGYAKVECALRYATELNPNCDIIPYKLFIDSDNADGVCCDYDVVVDCSDNFVCKYILNRSCMNLGLIFISASVERFRGFVGIFGAEHGCYNCLFPYEGIIDSPKCVEVGVLGPVVGVIATQQAYMVLGYVIGLIKIGTIFDIDLKSMHVRHLNITDVECNICNACRLRGISNVTEQQVEINFVKYNAIPQDALLVDVRTVSEYTQDHIFGAINIPVNDIHVRYVEIKSDRPVVLYCTVGKRSSVAFRFLWEIGMRNVFVLDQSMSE